MRAAPALAWSGDTAGWNYYFWCPRETSEGGSARNEYCFRGQGGPEEGQAVEGKREGEQRGREEDVEPEAGKRGTHSEEGVGPKTTECGTLPQRRYGIREGGRRGVLGSRQRGGRCNGIRDGLESLQKRSLDPTATPRPWASVARQGELVEMVIQVVPPSLIKRDEKKEKINKPIKKRTLTRRSY
ncbi:hypothetical protein NDU88_004341 [Pleurodeles waltl]|uniref:Uncharacterized protein n=1 Tax=Pleurodeles waltl TaxID=8319 RepID=A0AAV7TRN2_PLEWA|nr:hypothetical protein NDU88_004341 [Pleurodeles waltl]